jgi:hypothetical protein
MRRAERARLFLDLLDTTIQQGRPLEETLISASQSGDPSLGVRFHLLAAWLERNLRLRACLNNQDFDPGVEILHACVVRR